MKYLDLDMEDEAVSFDALFTKVPSHLLDRVQLLMKSMVPEPDNIQRGRSGTLILILLLRYLFSFIC